MDAQLDLIPGFYFCHNCGRDVKRTRRTRSFCLCDACWAQITPDWEQVTVVAGGRKRDAAWYAETKEQRDRIEAYWGWVAEMGKRYPPRVARLTGTARYRSYVGAVVTLDADAYWPLCACGNRRREMKFGGFPPGLFGGPFCSLCPVCEGKAELATLLNMAAHLHPEWDDEDWLDFLSKTHPHLFDLGILPDGWFQLNKRQRKDT